jgi:hypothetical protein
MCGTRLQSTLVTYQQAGHSYPINPGSFASGAILTTSSIMVLHRGHAKPRLFETSVTLDTTPCESKLRSSIDNPPACDGFYLEEKRA